MKIKNIIIGLVIFYVICLGFAGFVGYTLQENRQCLDLENQLLRSRSEVVELNFQVNALKNRLEIIE